MPEGETTESQETKRKTLQDMHKLSKKEWDWKVIKKNMEESFYLQRKDINGSLAANSNARRKRKRPAAELEENVDQPDENLTVSAIRERWPFLFTPRGMNYHIKKLTGIDFKDKLGEFIKEESGLLIEFLPCKGEEQARIKRDMIRAERNGHSPIKFPTVLQMLAAFLLVRFVEVSILNNKSC